MARPVHGDPAERTSVRRDPARDLRDRSGTPITVRVRTQSLLPLVCLLGGLGAIGYAGAQSWEGIASRGWPAVPGEVVSSQVVATQGGTGSASHSGGHRALVRYAYTVDGVRHEGDRISVARVSKTRAHAAEVAARFPEGAPVEVHHDPDDPARALLEPGVTVAGVLPAALGVALLVAGFVFRRR